MNISVHTLMATVLIVFIKLTIPPAFAGTSLFSVAECIDYGTNGCEVFSDGSYMVEIVPGDSGEFPKFIGNCSIYDEYSQENYFGPCYAFEYLLTIIDGKGPTHIDFFIPTEESAVYAAPMYGSGTHYSDPGQGGLNTRIGLGSLDYRIFEWSMNVQKNRFGIITNVPEASDTSTSLRIKSRAFVTGKIQGPTGRELIATTEEVISVHQQELVIKKDKLGGLLDVKDKYGQSFNKADAKQLNCYGSDPSKAMPLDSISSDHAGNIVMVFGPIMQITDDQKIMREGNPTLKVVAARASSCLLIYGYNRSVRRYLFMWRCSFPNGDVAYYDFFTSQPL